MFSDPFRTFKVKFIVWRAFSNLSRPRITGTIAVLARSRSFVFLVVAIHPLAVRRNAKLTVGTAPQHDEHARIYCLGWFLSLVVFGLIPQLRIIYQR